jgi:hypothetical protein
MQLNSTFDFFFVLFSFVSLAVRLQAAVQWETLVELMQ